VTTRRTLPGRRDGCNGVEYGLSFAEYLATPAMSCSGLKLLRKSPAHFLAGDNPEAEQKPSLRRGSLLHTLVLEPAKISARYCVKPDGMNFATKEGKSWRDSVAEGLEIVTSAEYRTASRQAISLGAVPEVASLLGGAGASEVSFFWTDPETGITCKGRADWVFRTDAGVILLDLKTTEDASPEAFARSCARYGYHMQAPWYIDGWTQCTGDTVLGFVFGAVESGWPHVAQAYMLDDDSVSKGRAECRRLLNQYASCLDADTWPGYAQEVQSINLPAWA
jgi:hypothetical protein